MKLKEIFNDALPIISKFAPGIGGALGGPFGAIAGAAIPLLSSAFGSQSGNLKELAQSILNDPDAEHKLSACENELGKFVDSLVDDTANLKSAEINIKLEWQPDLKNN